MSISLKADAGGTSGSIQIGGVDKVVIGSTGIAAGSYAPLSVTPSELSQKLTLGTAQNTTSGTSIDFTGIPSWVKRITVMLNGVSTSGSNGIIFQIGNTTPETSGYNGASFSNTGGSATAVTSMSSGFIAIPAGVSTMVSYGYFYLTLMNPTTNTWAFGGSLSRTDIAHVSFASGVKATASVIDRIRITTVGGTDTFDAGSVNVMYE